MAAEEKIARGGDGQGPRLARGVLKLWTDDLAGSHRDFAGIAEASRRANEYFDPSEHALALMADVEYRSGAWQDALVHAEMAASCAADAGRSWQASIAHAIAGAP